MVLQQTVALLERAMSISHDNSLYHTEMGNQLMMQVLILIFNSSAETEKNQINIAQTGSQMHIVVTTNKNKSISFNFDTDGCAQYHIGIYNNWYTTKNSLEVLLKFPTVN